MRDIINVLIAEKALIGAVFLPDTREFSPEIQISSTSWLVLLLIWRKLSSTILLRLAVQRMHAGRASAGRLAVWTMPSSLSSQSPAYLRSQKIYRCIKNVLWPCLAPPRTEGPQQMKREESSGDLGGLWCEVEHLVSGKTLHFQAFLCVNGVPSGCAPSHRCAAECDGKRSLTGRSCSMVRWQQDPASSEEGLGGLGGGWVTNSWSQIPPSATSLQRGLFLASLSSEEIRYFTLAFVSVPTKDLQTSSSEAERDLSLRVHVKGIIINVQKNKNKLAAKMPIIS